MNFALVTDTMRSVSTDKPRNTSQDVQIVIIHPWGLRTSIVPMQLDWDTGMFLKLLPTGVSGLVEI